MKLSISWLSDHLKSHAPLRIVPTDWAEHIIELLARSTTEVDSVERIVIDLDTLVLAQQLTTRDNFAILHDAESARQHVLPIRTDSIPESWYFLKKNATTDRYDYATYTDLGGIREGYAPPVMVTPQDAHGAWKKYCDLVDYRITIDNKAITHRPDLWSHRGFAREIAALLSQEINSLETMVASVPHITVDATQERVIQTPTCDYFGRLAIPGITMRLSPPWLALRLIRLDSRPINLFVDATNYVMLDLGQPLHVFDADKVHEAHLIVRQARHGETLTLLDDKTIQLNHHDCIIADSKTPLSLAGIMGGKMSGCHPQTQSIVIESAHFAPIAIRASATHHRIRTEASSRFEKDIDPHMVVPALQRYLRLITAEGIALPPAVHIATEGSLPTTRTITLEHDYIERKLGITVERQHVISLLARLGILLSLQHSSSTSYTLCIPSWRMRDLKEREDIVEEIARSIGYDAIIPTLPPRLAKPASFQRSHTVAALKQHMAFGWRMQEVHNYAFYDEQFLKQSGLCIDDAITLKNPVSEQWQRLVSSLIPHLLKNISQNIPEHDELRFFEMNETWSYQKSHDTSLKRRDHGLTLGIMWYTRHKTIDFYTGMQVIDSLSERLRLPLTVHAWQQHDITHHTPWYDTVRRAIIRCPQGKIVGTSGMLNSKILGSWCEGTAFCAEISLESLLSRTPSQPHYHAVSKFPIVTQDISVMVPYSNDTASQKSWGSVAGIIRDLTTIDSRIIDVTLIDFFEKEAWRDQRSLTLRVTIADTTKTLTREEIDAIMQQIKEYFSGQGAVIR